MFQAQTVGKPPMAPLPAVAPPSAAADFSKARRERFLCTRFLLIEN
jgi:hypothetical protein